MFLGRLVKFSAIEAGVSMELFVASPLKVLAVVRVGMEWPIADSPRLKTHRLILV